MSDAVQPRPISLAKSALLVLLLALLLLFNQGKDLVYGLFSFALLASYHLFTDSRFSSEQIRHTGLMALHIGVYLLLCTLVVWVTTEEEESVNWIIYLLPVAVAAASLSLKHTLTTCAVATVLFLSQVPPALFLDPAKRSEELPELLVFAITFFLVGVLIQSYSEQSRRQLARQQELNERLLENQAILKESLDRLNAAEETLRRQDRLAALGEMSAGIAHEIRNPLGVISSSAQLLGKKIDDPAEGTRQLLDIIQEETIRLNGLITDFLTFGRPAQPVLCCIDLRTVSARAVEHIEGLARERSIQVVAELPETPMPASVDPDMIQQVLLNLLLNALEASRQEGVVTVRLQPADTSLRLEVHDNGCGIPPENLSKIFNPFFTTKEKGTGLGLANAHRLIEMHGGSLTVSSSQEAGTTFCITLPRQET
jgi:signal transduction histidine kinase